MRIAKVVGKLSLNRVVPELVGKRWVLAVPHCLAALVDGKPAEAEELVAVDELGARADDWIGLTEGMEAAFPYHPERKPVDAYNACILDALDIDQAAARRLLET
jgi:ethanolamine utilization protein EutN